MENDWRRNLVNMIVNKGHAPQASSMHLDPQYQMYVTDAQTNGAPPEEIMDRKRWEDWYRQQQNQQPQQTVGDLVQSNAGGFVR